MPTHRIPSRSSLTRGLSSAALLACAAAQAQTPACDRFKAELTERISRNPGSFRIEALPSDAALPAGGRVVGNCGGGRWKMVLLTGGAAAAVPAASPASAARDASAARPAAAPVRLPAVAAAPAPTAAAAAEPAAPKPMVTASPKIAPGPSLPASAPPRPAASTASSMTSTPASASTAMRPPEAPGAPADAPASEAAATGLPLRGGPLPWLAGALVLLAAIGVWRWIVYRMHYDAAGLPRGPRLR